MQLRGVALWIAIVLVSVFVFSFAYLLASEYDPECFVYQCIKVK